MAEEETTVRHHSFVLAALEPNVTVSHKSLLSFRIKFLDIAEAAAESLVTLERENLELRGWYDEAFTRAANSILMSSFAVEAALNEAMMDMRVSQTDLNIIDRQQGLLDKADAIAARCRFAPVDRGRNPAQGVALLYKIRNALVHAKAEWSDERKTNFELSKQIVARGLPLSPYASSGDMAFPIACMSAGVAQWAVQMARSFIEEFYGAAGLRP